MPPPDASTVDTVLLPALVSLATALVVSAAGWWWTARQERRARQAQLFADAYAAVQAYKEFPFAVRRRDSSDRASERRRISEALREVQQDIAFHEAWLDLHDRRVAEAYSDLVSRTRRTAGRLMHEAWSADPITSDAEMNIADIGPALAALEPAQRAYLDAVRYSRRLVRRP